MDHMRRWTERISTGYLVAFLIVTDVILFLGGAPLDVYLRAIILSHGVNAGLLLGTLALNVTLIALLAAAMVASTIVTARGLRRVARVTVPVARSVDGLRGRR